MDKIKIVWISAYKVTRRFGGHEEGGWYYNHYELLESIPARLPNAELVRDQLIKDYQDVAHGDIYSVLGGAELEVITEDKAGYNATVGRPHYE